MQTEQSGGVMQVGEWRVDPVLDTISRGTETHKLEPRTMRLLVCLANSAGAVVSVDRILTEVWSGVVVGSASVYQAVSQLRKLLGDVDADPTYIATVPRKGYRLLAQVSLQAAVALRGDAAALAVAPDQALRPALTRRSFAILSGGGVVLLAIAIAGFFLWSRYQIAKRAAPNDASIVVLPFIDMTAEKMDQPFCDGLTEELSSWLAQIPALHVVARTSAFAFRGKNEDVRAIGKELGINHVLEGSLRRSGDLARISVQLIDARNGFHIWSENYDRPLEDAIKLQEDISRTVAATLQMRLTPDTERQFAARRTANSQAYQWFLLGRHYAQQMTRESTESAIGAFQKVVSADPKFAPAYTQLAYARLNQGYFQALPTTEVAAQMEPLIAMAFMLDERMSAAFAVRGALRAAQSRTQEGLDDLNRAIALDPNDMSAFAEIGRIRLIGGQPREALKQYSLAAALDPLNHTLQEQLCTALEDLARFDDAARACARARDLNPGTPSATDLLGWLAESQGHMDAALDWNAQSLKDATSEDFDYYWTRADFFLSLGLAPAARAAIERGRGATKDDVDANIALLRVVYCEGGTSALRSYTHAAHLDQSNHAVALFESAHASMLLGDAAAAKQLIARALLAPDRTLGYAEDPWYARGERLEQMPYKLDLAAAELALGDNVSAQRDLNGLLSMFDEMIAAGIDRHGTYELRAKVYALQGRGDEAMRDLDKAASLGWRRVWWAIHEPYFASLKPRSDFRALMARVGRSNEVLAEKIAQSATL